KITASSDGGLHFGGQFYVNDNGDFGNHMSTPRLVVSQGTPVDPNDPTAVARVTSGQVSIVWDDLNQNGDRDVIRTDRIEDGASVSWTDGSIGLIDEATLVQNPPPGAPPNIPAITEFTADVDIT